MQGNNKRRCKIAEQVKEDRLSNLPTHLLIDILSLLPTKLAVRSIVLARKWRHISASVPILDFDYWRDVRYCSLKRFITVINRCLILNRSSRIRSFRVHFKYDRAVFASDVDVWLSKVTLLNVIELVLDFSGYGDEDYEEDFGNENGVDDASHYHLPMSEFCNNWTLEILILKRCVIYRGSKQIVRGSLNHLVLSEMLFEADFLTELLSGCPLLQVLELHDCRKLSFLEINSQRLRKLVVSDTEEFPDDTKGPEYADDPAEPIELKISAPYLQSLIISGFLPKYSFTNLRSLVDAELNFDYESLPVYSHISHAKYFTLLEENLRILWYLCNFVGLQSKL